MAKKQLQVVVTAVDQMTGPMRQIVLAVGAMGNSTERAGRQADGWLTRITRHFTSLTGIAQGLVAGYALRGVVRSFNETAESLEQIDRVAAQTGASVEKLSEWRFIARRNGIEFETMAKGMTKAQERMVQFVRTGGGPAAEALTRLNVRATDARGAFRGIDELLPELLTQLGKVPDVAERIDLASALFGGSGDEFVALVNRGADAIDGFRGKARALGAVFTPEQVELARRYQNALRDLGDAWLGVKVRVFEQIGPFLTDLAENAARVSAIVPKMLGSLFENIRAAMTDAGGGGDKARQLFVDFFDKLAGAAADVMLYGGGLLVHKGVQLVYAFFDALAPEFKTAMTSFIVNNTVDVVRALPDLLDPLFATYRVMLPKQMKLVDKYITPSLNQARGFTDDFLKGIKVGTTEAARGWFMAGHAIDKYNAQMSDAGMLQQAWDGAMAVARKEIVGSGSDLLGSLDAIFQWTSAWAQSTATMQEYAARSKEARDNSRELREQTFFQGLETGAREFYAESQRFFDQGREYYNGVAGAIVGTLSPALVNAAGDVQNLGKYMREFASSALRQIAELTTRMLLFRAVAGIGNAVFSGGVTATGITSDNNVLVGTYGAFANTGGFITRTGVRRYAGGGYVPGPNVNRDVVPALLTPGEFVLNRAATARAGAANLARFNRGGAVGGGGVGGGTSVTMVNNITINSSSGNPQEIGRAVVDAIDRYAPDAVANRLARSAAYRERMRGGLS